MTGIKMPIHLSDIRFPTEYIFADRPGYCVGVRIGAYPIILNSEMNSQLPYNICYLASVYADFCRRTGLESVRPMPGTYSLRSHQGYHKLSVYGKTQYYSQCGKTIWPLCHPHWRCHIGLWRTHIGTYSYHDYRPALQAVFSVIYMSVIMVSQHESSK